MTDRTAIAWYDLTYKISSLVTLRERPVLHCMSGSADFGTMTAVMGPSGAGLTSLLKCLNVCNISGLETSSHIRTSAATHMRSSFVGHNEKEFLIMGLTVKHNLLYASRLKNSESREPIDHQMNVRTVMEDLMITDTADTLADRCSGGEQKRLAFGLELTARDKPNLMLCSDPTTGLNSNIAEVVIDCLNSRASACSECNTCCGSLSLSSSLLATSGGVGSGPSLPVLSLVLLSHMFLFEWFFPVILFSGYY